MQDSVRFQYDTTACVRDEGYWPESSTIVGSPDQGSRVADCLPEAVGTDRTRSQVSPGTPGLERAWRTRQCTVVAATDHLHVARREGRRAEAAQVELVRGIRAKGAGCVALSAAARRFAVGTACLKNRLSPGQR